MSRISDHYRPRHGSSPQYPPKVAYDDDEALPQWEPPQPPDMEPPAQFLSTPNYMVTWWLLTRVLPVAVLVVLLGLAWWQWG